MCFRIVVAIYFLLLPCFSLSSTIIPEEKLNAIGRILESHDAEKSIGTAFVAGDSASIFTCAHVAIEDTLWFDPLGSRYCFRISIKYVLPGFDLAVYERTAGEQKVTLDFGDIRKLRPGDEVKYIGWDKEEDKYIIRSASIAAMGSAVHESRIIDFVEFSGKAIPGYSGGPVLNENGEVVAMIREGWTKRGIKGGPEELVIRAFSVELLSILEHEVRPSVEKRTSGSKKSLLDIYSE